LQSTSAGTVCASHDESRCLIMRGSARNSRQILHLRSGAQAQAHNGIHFDAFSGFGSASSDAEQKHTHHLGVVFVSNSPTCPAAP
jgi:hypothetical protein